MIREQAERGKELRKYYRLEDDKDNENGEIIEDDRAQDKGVEGVEPDRSSSEDEAAGSVCPCASWFLCRGAGFVWCIFRYGRGFHSGVSRDNNQEGLRCSYVALQSRDKCLHIRIGFLSSAIL